MYVKGGKRITVSAGGEHQKKHACLKKDSELTQKKKKEREEA